MFPCERAWRADFCPSLAQQKHARYQVAQPNPSKCSISALDGWRWPGEDLHSGAATCLAILQPRRPRYSAIPNNSQAYIRVCVGLDTQARLHVNGSDHLARLAPDDLNLKCQRRPSRRTARSFLAVRSLTRCWGQGAPRLSRRLSSRDLGYEYLDKKTENKGHKTTRQLTAMVRTRNSQPNARSAAACQHECSAMIA